jgi:hypothetical protein
VALAFGLGTCGDTKPEPESDYVAIANAKWAETHGPIDTAYTLRVTGTGKFGVAYQGTSITGTGATAATDGHWSTTMPSDGIVGVTAQNRGGGTISCKITIARNSS